MRTPSFEAPAWVDPAAWAAFIEMRKAKGKRAPFTVLASERIVFELDRLRSQGHPPAEVLWQSVVNGWSGVFPLKHLANFAARSVSPDVDATARYILERAERQPEAPSAAHKAKLDAVRNSLRRGNQS